MNEVACGLCIAALQRLDDCSIIIYSRLAEFRDWQMMSPWPIPSGLAAGRDDHLEDAHKEQVLRSAYDREMKGIFRLFELRPCLRLSHCFQMARQGKQIFTGG